MSEMISDVARAQVFLADYAIADAGNKINALGVGFQLALLQPTATTAPQCVVAVVEVPPHHAGEDMAVELALYDDGGELVKVPGLLGQDSTAIRFAQNVTLQAGSVAIQGLRIPKDALWPRHHVVANLQNGIPVLPGRAYEWRLSIDTVTRIDWAARFYVPAPAGGLVVG